MLEFLRGVWQLLVIVAVTAAYLLIDLFRGNNITVQSTDSTLGGATMFSGGTIADLLVFVFGTGAFLSGVIERFFPGWNSEKFPGWAKKLIVGAVGLFAPVVLIALQLYIPPDVLHQTGGQLLAGVAVALAAIVAHQIDLILQALSAAVKAKLDKVAFAD